MFKLTVKQEEAQATLAGSATHGMLYGGSRSGKTFLHVRNVVMRAVKAPESRHAILRLRFNHLKASVILDTFPKVMKICFPGLNYELSKTDWYASLPNGSQIWFGGLDDKERTEKILGQEYATVYLNECSQISNEARDMVATRLAQLAPLPDDGTKVVKYLKPRMFYDCNPTNKAHWSYQMFIKKVDPDTKKPLLKPEDFVHCKMNPEDNAENLSETYLDTLRALSARSQRRFLRGEFSDATPNALFNEIDIDKWRHLGGELPDFVRVIVAVDPSGSGDILNADADAIGICVVALGTDGNAYVLEDLTVKAGPSTWGRIAVDAYDRHEADMIVGEANYGGAMVQHVIQTARPRTPYKAVHATRGKVVRAEPISALYEQGKVRHVGEFRELEDELVSFSTAGYTGARSPNRADALIWGLTEIFPGIVKKHAVKSNVIPMYHPRATTTSWMAA